MMIAGCATAPQVSPVIETRHIGRTYHTVRPGETLWGISKMYGVDLNSLVKANSIQDSSSIEKGQVLLIPVAVRGRAPVKYSARDSFLWPVRGYIAASFGSKVDKIKNKGIDIRADEGANVKASRSGRVVYCDSYLKGFGKTVILDHADNYQTVYSYNSDILVKAGDPVQQNDVIAKVGKSGRAKEPTLHFEIRKDGEPQNPAYYLPR